MEIPVIFLGILKYQDKNSKEDKYRLSYVLANKEAINDSDKLKGVVENGLYTDNSKLWESLKSTDALSQMTFIVETRPSKNNPLKTVTELTKVITKNTTIEL